MNLTCDMHMHSTESIDGEHGIGVMCRTAIELGLTTVCFTEHVDFSIHDEGFGFFQPDRYAREIERAREAHGHRLTVLMGIEFSEPHRHPREFEGCLDLGLDFLLASVHTYGNAAVPTSNGDLARIFDAHYAETLAAVHLGGFDSLAHIDLPRRYLGESTEPMDRIEEVLAEVIRRGIALEINTCPMRKGPPAMLPSDSILGAYARLGGVAVTVGSDAHHRNQIGRRFDEAEEKLERFGLQPQMFLARVRHPAETVAAPG